MATRLNQIFEAYMKALEEYKEKYGGTFDISVLQGLAFQSLPETLKKDEYTELERIDENVMRFKLIKEKDVEGFLERVRKKGYEVFPVEGEEKIIFIKIEHFKFKFDLKEKTPYLITSAYDHENDVAFFLEKLYSE